jgi:hypothetical protein
MTTTLLFYGHWFPKGDRHYVEQGKCQGGGDSIEDADSSRRLGRYARCGRGAKRRFMAPLWHHKRIGHLHSFGSARFFWWAVKDLNLGPAD